MSRRTWLAWLCLGAVPLWAGCAAARPVQFVQVDVAPQYKNDVLDAVRFTASVRTAGISDAQLIYQVRLLDARGRAVRSTNGRYQNAAGEVAAAKTFIIQQDPWTAEGLSVAIPLDELELTEDHLPAAAEFDVSTPDGPPLVRTVRRLPLHMAPPAERVGPLYVWGRAPRNDLPGTEPQEQNVDGEPAAGPETPPMDDAAALAIADDDPADAAPGSADPAGATAIRSDGRPPGARTVVVPLRKRRSWDARDGVPVIEAERPSSKVTPPRPGSARGDPSVGDRRVARWRIESDPAAESPAGSPDSATSQPADTGSASAPAGRPSDSAPAPGGGRTFTVRAGDSLFSIAKEALGDGNRWEEIYSLNRHQLATPDRIREGMVLRLPQD